MRLVPADAHGVADVNRVNTSEFTEEYLADSQNPRWVAKPTVAYLWARAVKCKACRATLPLPKTRWLCKKTNKRVLLTMEPNPERSKRTCLCEAEMRRRNVSTTAAWGCYDVAVRCAVPLL